MEYISSDTNVWIDFSIIGRLSLPFKLPYEYLMDEDTISDELQQPVGLGIQLKELGLIATELSEEEFFLAEQYNAKYKKPTLYDCIALAIAKSRGLILLTGDGPLRNAANTEGVKVIGTIGLLDKLYDTKTIDDEEYLFCLSELQRNNGGKVRLPKEELEKRINSILL